MALMVADAEQREAASRKSYAAWGEGLTLEQFLIREHRLQHHPWALKNMTTWVLAGDAPGEVLASCETFRMTSRLEGTAGATHGVASVFTEPRLRGRGYASRMMALLGAELARDPTAHASILFSDVGEALYARAGYAPRPAVEVTFTPEGGDPAGAVDRLIEETAVTNEHHSLAPPAGEFAVWPSDEQLDWHLERERVWAALLGRPRPEAAGARAGKSLALWAANFKWNCLAILLLCASSAVEAAAVVQAARRIAGRARLAAVELWDCPLAGELGGTRVRRTHSLPMIRPLDARLTPEAWTFIPRALWI